MDVRIEADPERYEQAVRGFLRRDPFSTNVLSVELAGVLAGTRPLAEGSMWISAHDADGGVIGAAMRTPPFNLFLPKMPDAVIGAIAGKLAEAGAALPGVTGEQETAESFCRRWSELTGVGAEVLVRMRLYVLGTLRPPGGVSGAATRASSEDVDSVASWFEAFHEEAQAESPRTDARAHAARRVANGEIWLWEDGGQPVAMAAASLPAVGISRIGPVYTPPDRRRRGYGAAVTAAASDAARADGAEDVILYTDLANPVSNSIYQTIGYKPHHDSLELRFVADREGDTIGT